MAYSSNLLFEWPALCCWNHRVVPIFNLCLDVQTMELNVFLSLDNIQLLRMYINSRMSNIRTYRYYFPHIITLK
jgi:hypothetical protein